MWVAAPPGKYLHVAASSCVCGPAEFAWRRAWRMAAESPCAQAVAERRTAMVHGATNSAVVRCSRLEHGVGIAGDARHWVKDC